MDIYPPEAWQRLGKALERRRGQLGYGFRQRGRFARDRGGNLSSKTLARLEHGERDAYPEATLGVVEAMYRWQPGSIAQVLNGGEPQPIRDDSDLPSMSDQQALALRLDQLLAERVPTRERRDAIRDRLGMNSRFGSPAGDTSDPAFWRALAGELGMSVADLLVRAGAFSEAELRLNDRPAEPRDENPRRRARSRE